MANYVLLISLLIAIFENVESKILDKNDPFFVDVSTYQNFDPATVLKNDQRSPVILMPGLEASQVEARLVDKKETRHFFCSKNSDWFLIWLNPEEFIPLVVDCFMDNFKLSYDHKLRRTQNAQGVEIRIPGFGDTHSVEYLSNIEIGPLTYFHNLVEKLVEIGYERGKSVRGAPYDFRKSPNENEEYFLKLTNLVEETYVMNGNTKNTLVCHSMGCLYSLYFLNRSPQEWKDKYIKELITISAPFGGAAQSVHALAAGTNFHLFIYKDRDFRELERTFSSLSFLLPIAEIWKETPILTIEGNNYTSAQLGQLYDLLSDKDGKEMWKDNKGLIADHKHPGVDVVCIHGASKPTPERVVYQKVEDFPDKFEIVYGDGDGTVNDVSARICRDWANDNRYKFVGKTIPDIGHLEMARHENVIDYVVEKLAN